LDLLRPAEKNSPQHEFGRASGMRLSVGERQSTAPGSAKHLPPLDAQKLAQLFNVSHQIPGRVLFERSMRRALSRAALIEKHDAIGVWIVKLPILRHQPATRPAMQKDHRFPLWIAALLVINLMNVRDLQPAGVIGLDWRVKSSKLSHGVDFIFEQPFRPANSSYGSFDCSAEGARC